MQQDSRRNFIRNITLGSVGATLLPSDLFSRTKEKSNHKVKEFKVNSISRDYNDKNLDHIAFPIGGLGAGMFCLEGNGAIGSMSVRNRPEVFNEPAMFAAIKIKGVEHGAKILQGAVPDYKAFGRRGSGLGDVGLIYGLPRFSGTEFSAAFPFATVSLADKDLPLQVSIKGWSPFIPTDEDNSGLPAGALIYTFKNTGNTTQEAIFSFNAKNFLASDNAAVNKIASLKNGFVLQQEATNDKPFLQSNFAIWTDDDNTIVDHCWFRGNWWDPITMAWNNISDGNIKAAAPIEKDAPGASLFLPFSLQVGESKTIHLKFAWYSPDTSLKMGERAKDDDADCCHIAAQLNDFPVDDTTYEFYKPWYASKFKSIFDVADHWNKNYDSLLKKTTLFNESFYKSTLPAEVIDAVGSNLSILKSPTVLRQYDGRLWCWEGSDDDFGSCHGSCTHVWNYAQATAHLFPNLERTLRNTEFCESQNKEGHQMFRSNLPVSPVVHNFHAAADGQLGGIMKVYREWRISADGDWLKKIFPLVKTSLDYCIRTWDPKNKGVVEEPHHNTYDIEFWGAEPMCTTFYLGALYAIIKMGKSLKEDVSKYQSLYDKGKSFLENQLYNGEYFFQQIEYKELNAADPTKVQSFGGAYSPEAIDLLKKEGPKYQYGKGCLSDGVLGAWIAAMCGLETFLDKEKITAHLLSVHKYNLKNNLHEHANPQRPGYALNDEGGLLLCTWPKGGKLSLPFVYSNEVWTGIEYQVASHLMLMGKVDEGLDIVRACRNRYNGVVRNPFNEYECGHWYARALSSYGLLQGLTGVRYDAVGKILYVDSKVGDFVSFLSTATGFGNVVYKNGKASVDVAYGKIDVKEIKIKGTK